MRSTYLVLVCACAGMTLSGCERAASPAAVQREVAKAREVAAMNDARAAGRAEERVATAAFDQAVIDAEGVHRVSMAQCDALERDAQKTCKDTANATLAMAKAYARASLAQR